jgi:site-specific recombinase XerD
MENSRAAPEAAPEAEAPVNVALHWEHGRLASVETTSPDVAHFLDFVRMRHPYNTWVNYACDLKVFFGVVRTPPDHVTRKDCIRFMAAQDEARRAVSTINRRLAAVSSLFDELMLRDPARFPENPVSPRMNKTARKLYKRPLKRIPDILADDELRALFTALPTWRDRTLLLLQWVSCLRVSEALAVRFADVECSHKRIRISDAKNKEPRSVYMDDDTFRVFNCYLDRERAALERIGGVVDEDTIFLAFRGPNRGRKLSVNAVQKLLKYYAIQCHLPHVHAHLLRHTGITQLLENGMREPAVRTLVGHKRPESLEPYKHLSDHFTEREFHRAAPALALKRLAADPYHQRTLGARDQS